MGGLTSEVSVIAGDGEEGLQNLSIQQTLGVLSGLVAHEAIDECVCSRLNKYTTENTVEEVRVLAN